MSQGRSFDQPSPESCSPSAYDAAYPVGMARMGYLAECDDGATENSCGRSIIVSL